MHATIFLCALLSACAAFAFAIRTGAMCVWGGRGGWEGGGGATATQGASSQFMGPPRGWLNFFCVFMGERGDQAALPLAGGKINEFE
jgi:hypothetical protein